ncbi:MAG TPA: dethiobiotin synthase [Candidatus Limnocylindria bacterium]|nr:dethiobiotin synthase [Candidatus Limnocylindria bacterium]
MTAIFVISANDTGVGKTVFTVALARWLRSQGASFRALKPLCSGGRDDAEALQAAQGGGITLDRVNPWYFREPLAPPIAARREGRDIRLAEIIDLVRSHATEVETVVVEAAGGLLSPYASDGDALELIEALDARPILICPNRLGVINQALLLWRVMPPKIADRARLVLMTQAEPDGSAAKNVAYLRQKFGDESVFEFPHISVADSDSEATKRIEGILEKICANR